jgi:hypothetical protein
MRATFNKWGVSKTTRQQRGDPGRYLRIDGLAQLLLNPFALKQWIFRDAG